MEKLVQRGIATLVIGLLLLWMMAAIVGFQAQTREIFETVVFQLFNRHDDYQ